MSATAATTAPSSDAPATALDGVIAEARRQLEICNACRYCEGYCSVFPAVTRRRAFPDADVVQLANLCHNCRGCFYACQFTPPHEFALNVPAALADVRQQGWQDDAAPSGFARTFHRHGLAIAMVVILAFATFLYAMRALGENAGGEGFYALLSHAAMVAIFIPAFVAPLVVVGLSLKRYWARIGAPPFRLRHLASALHHAAVMKDLSGGHGEGCNFEDEDRFSSTRRWFHQLTLWGFMACFAATSAATVMHYVLDWPAPYGFWTLPKLLGVPGGIALSVGTAGLAWLKTKADPALGASAVYGGEMAFIVLLFIVSTSGLALYWFGDTSALATLLALHLGAVFAFFVLTPYTKMVHGFQRLAALTADAAEKAATR